VRDYIVKSKPRQKTVVPGMSIEIALALQKTVGMITSGADPALVIEELHKINNKLLGI